MIYCTARSALLSSPFLSVVFSPRCLLFPACQAMESNYTVRKVYSDLLKALNAICFVPSLCPPEELSPDTQMRRSECSLLTAPSWASSRKPSE